jgi:hypothetical protein
MGNMTGKMIVLERGVCSFLEKAQAGHAIGATVLAVVNNVDKVESPSSGLGVDKEIKEEAVLAVKELCMVRHV